MAKKKEKEAVDQEGNVDLVESALSSIRKNYGDEIVVQGRNVLDRPRKVISLGPSLDLITGGGIPEGSWVGVSGNPKCCKTSIILSFAAEAQKPENSSRPVFYAKIEGRLSHELLKGTKGLDLDRFHVIGSQMGKVLTSQDYLTILSDVIKSVPGAVVVIDSTSALCDERELNDGIGTETRGGGAKLFAQFCRLNANIVPVQGCIVFCVQQTICNTSGRGPAMIEKGSRALQYQLDVGLKVKQKEPWMVGTRQIGYIVKWQTTVSALGPPGMSYDSYVRFGVGIDRLYELIMLGMASGLIQKSGSWLNLPFLQSRGVESKAHGAEKLYQTFIENPQWASWLTEDLRKMTGGIEVGGGDE